ncbi:hypothetical protein AZ66_28425 [Paenibacillus sp. E194]|uniref:hypothetical protein n=1 Tax=Paenibacillus sp. E194 TaxID=1458845 RepID=UPI0005C931CC|nr:hypothetical protein [Paenibacillus sp. E194]KJB84844.1 hypothetical protein AZ66_28425 [Paenibacillus sp. E194]
MDNEGVGIPTVINSEILKKHRELSEQYRKLINSVFGNIINFQALAKLSDHVSSTFANIPKNFDPNTFIQDRISFINSNTKYGWCMSAKMSFARYREIARLEDKQEIRDSYFLEEFEKDKLTLYQQEKEYIISTSDNDWREFYEDLFFSFRSWKI